MFVHFTVRSTRRYVRVRPYEYRGGCLGGDGGRGLLGRRPFSMKISRRTCNCTALFHICGYSLYFIVIHPRGSYIACLLRIILAAGSAPAILIRLRAARAVRLLFGMEELGGTVIVCLCGFRASGFYGGVFEFLQTIRWVEVFLI